MLTKRQFSALLLFVSLFSFSQSYKVSYEQGITFSEKQLSQLPEAMKERMKRAAVAYSLYINGENSVFRSNSTFLGSTSSESNGRRETSSFTMKGAKYDLYKNLKNNNFYLETEVSAKEYNVAGKLPNIKWTITNETDTILGYKAKKAIGEENGKEVIVWYTEQIPVKDGPLFYRGVPGLVLKVKTDNTAYNVTSIEKADKEKIDFPTSKNTITLEEYYKHREEEIRINKQRLEKIEKGEQSAVSTYRTTVEMK